MDVKFVVFCAHDHGKHAKYCYATDVDPPTVVPTDAEDPFNLKDPKYKEEKDKDQGEQGPPEGKKPKKGGKKK
jgi:hypothetical protein